MCNVHATTVLACDVFIIIIDAATTATTADDDDDDDDELDICVMMRST